MSTQVTFADIQFSEKYDAEKARRLAENIQRLKRAFNELVQEFNSLSTSSGGVGTTVHTLATTAGLGVEHTVSGLTEGQVLKAVNENNAAFSTLAFAELEGVDPGTFLTAEDGDVLQFIDGYFSMAPLVDPTEITDARYLLASAHASLTNALVAGNSATIEFDLTVPGNFSASVKAGSITDTYLDRVHSRHFMLMGA